MKTIAPFWNKRNLNAEGPSSFWKEMDRFFEDFSVPEKVFSDRRDFMPVAEVTETEKSYIVSIDLPGLKKDEIKVEVLDGTLTLSGERKREEKFQEGDVRRIEKVYGSFKRTFALPSNADTEKIDAKYENGVLELSILKTQAPQSKKIEVQ